MAAVIGPQQPTPPGGTGSNNQPPSAGAFPSAAPASAKLHVET